MEQKRSFFYTVLRRLLPPVAVVLVLVYFFAALDSLQSGQSDESLRQLERALQRSCVACYAAEGVYPPDLAYLEEHYGIQIDETRYIVHYDIFASNLMPNITVLEKTP